MTAQYRWIKYGLLVAVGLFLAAGAKAREFDFEFRKMDISRVVTQLARLQGKSAIFSATVLPKTIDISLKDVEPDVALKLILESHGLVAVEKGSIYHVMTAVERGPAVTPTELFALRNVLARDIEPNIRSFMGNAGTVSLNESMNALVVSAPPETMARVQKLIMELDQENAQIYIEARIVETSTDFSRALGMEWGPRVGDRNALAGATLNAKANEATFMAGMTTLVGSRGQLEARLSAGERNGEVKIISQPKITTLNGVEANIESTRTFNVRTLATTNNTTTPGQPTLVGGIQTVKSGISLRVTPYIVSNQSVRLKIAISKSDPDFSREIDGLPGISDNSANTSLIVHTGETASIGGLRHNSQSSSSSGMPILSSIPVLGLLFGSQEKKRDDKELMIFLTPTIFRGRL